MAPDASLPENAILLQVVMPAHDEDDAKEFLRMSGCKTITVQSDKIARAETAAREILEAHRATHDALARALFSKGKLTRADIEEIIRVVESHL